MAPGPPGRLRFWSHPAPVANETRNPIVNLYSLPTAGAFVANRALVAVLVRLESAKRDVERFWLDRPELLVT